MKQSQGTDARAIAPKLWVLQRSNSSRRKRSAKHLCCTAIRFSPPNISKKPSLSRLNPQHAFVFNARQRLHSSLQAIRAGANICVRHYKSSIRWRILSKQQTRYRSKLGFITSLGVTKKQSSCCCAPVNWLGKRQKATALVHLLRR